MPKLLRSFVFGRKSNATPLAALLLGAFIYCAFAASHHVLQASQPRNPDLDFSTDSASLGTIPLLAPDPDMAGPGPATAPATSAANAPAAPPSQAAPAADPTPTVQVTVQRAKELASDRKSVV